MMTAEVADRLAAAELTYWEIGPARMRAMRDALDLIARHRFSYAPLVTHRFGLAEVDPAYELMDARDDGFVKAVLVPDDGRAARLNADTPLVRRGRVGIRR